MAAFEFSLKVQGAVFEGFLGIVMVMFLVFLDGG
jgi:hypothetical protein